MASRLFKIYYKSVDSCHLHHSYVLADSPKLARSAFIHVHPNFKVYDVMDLSPNFINSYVIA